MQFSRQVVKCHATVHAVSPQGDHEGGLSRSGRPGFSTIPPLQCSTPVASSLQCSTADPPRKKLFRTACAPGLLYRTPKLIIRLTDHLDG